MCFAPDTSAETAALQQQQATSAAATAKADAAAAQTAATIKQDQGIVDTAFQQFDPGYYQNYRDAYTGYYLPQVQDQYGQAADQLTAALAGNGTLESTVGANALANLAKRNTDQVAAIENQADAAVTQQQSNVSGQKTALYNEANAAMDPTQIAGSAEANTTALAAPQAYTPLSNVFADLVTPFSNYTKSAANAPVQGIPIPQTVLPNAYASAAAPSMYGG
jgi:hypothetical protein